MDKGKFIIGVDPGSATFSTSVIMRRDSYGNMRIVDAAKPVIDPEIIEVEAEEVEDEYVYIDGIKFKPTGLSQQDLRDTMFKKTLKIQPRPNYSWQDVLDQQLKTEEDE